jgi:NitT/TauT family transport system ATP-binding protein
MQLVARNLTHRFERLEVLSEVSFAVAEGEILAVIGPSGCGKSTLLGILGGLIRAESGTIEASGAEPDGCLNPITYVFQDFALLPWRSVEGNVALGLEHHPIGRAERDRRVGRVLEQTGLEAFADALPKQLSGGMRQRVGIARALAVEPAVLLMDEPLSSLDAQTRELLMEEFLAIWQRRRTTAVYVTHNLEEALRLADRVLVLSRRPGRVKATVAVEIPRAERPGESGQARLAPLRARLWDLMREEALTAEREVQPA